MARTMVVRKVAAVSAAFVALAVAFVAGTGSSATATQGQPVIDGQANYATSVTGIQNTDANEPAFRVDAAGTGIGISSIAGAAGIGVFGFTGGDCCAAYEGDGVHGSGSDNGVSGQTANRAASGVYGQNDGTGYGVAGRANYGTGVLADSSNGTALEVNGKAKFSRSGVVTISYPSKSAIVTGFPVTSKSLVLAAIQKYLAGVYVVAAVPVLSGSSNSFTIYLNKAPGTSTAPKSVTVGWYVVEHP